MEENEIQALENEQEEISQEVDTTEVATDETINLSKSEYSKLRRQALAYQANKGETKAKAEKSPLADDSRLRELELKIDGYNKDEIELIKEFGFEKVNNPIVQKAIEAIRQERKSKDADQVVSNKSAVYQKYTEADLKNMSVEELDKILPHAE